MKSVTIKLPCGKEFIIHPDKDAWKDNIGDIGSNPTKFFYDYYLAYEPSLMQYSGEEIKRSIIIKMD